MTSVRSRKRRNDARQGFLLIGLAIVLFVGVGTVFLKSHVPIDEDGCPMQPKVRLAIVIDRTDAVSSIGAARIKADIEGAVSELPAGAEATLWLQDGALVSKPTRRLCTMPPGDFATDKFKRDEREKFEHDVEDALDGLSLAKTSEKTMLVETVAAVASYQRDRPADQYRMVVVSDGLENSDYLAYRENGEGALDLWIKRGAPLPMVAGWQARFVEIKRLASPVALHLQEAGSAALLRGILEHGGASRVDVSVIPDRVVVLAADAITNIKSPSPRKGKRKSHATRSARQSNVTGGLKA